jgi:hypothetical protein
MKTFSALLSPWFRRAFSRLTARQGQRHRPAARRLRPALELLEVRAVPSTLQADFSSYALPNTPCVTPPCVPPPPVDPPLGPGTGANINRTEGEVFSGVVATFRDEDANGVPGQFTRGTTIDWGDGTQLTRPDRITGTPAKFFVWGTHTYKEERSSSDTVTVDIVDAGGADAIDVEGTATVTDAPLILTETTITPTANVPFSGKVGVLTDANPAAKAADFTVTIAWGDGQTSAGTVIPNSSGGFDITGRHTYATPGSFPFHLSVQDVGGSNASIDPVVNVAPQPGSPLSVTVKTIAPTANVPFSGKVGVLADANPAAKAADFTVSIAWGDGQTSVGTVSANGSGDFDITGSHTYATPGSFPLHISIQDASNDSTASFGVANVAPSGGGTVIATSTTVTASSTSVLEGQSVSITAMVTPSHGVLDGGSVTFLDGGTPLATVPVDTATNTAVLTAVLGSGPHSISAVYSGDSNFTASASAAISVTDVPSPAPLRPIMAALAVVRVGKKRRLMVEVFFADTGALKSRFRSPFQHPRYHRIQVSVIKGNGNDVADQVVLMARRGRRALTKVFPG